MDSFIHNSLTVDGGSWMVDRGSGFFHSHTSTLPHFQLPLPTILITGTIISSMLTPPCWKLLR
jgi:hypothetical protein